jgi:hypothetical protein
METEQPQKLPSSAEARALLYDYVMTQFAGEKKKNGIGKLSLVYEV